MHTHMYTVLNAQRTRSRFCRLQVRENIGLFLLNCFSAFDPFLSKNRTYLPVFIVISFGARGSLLPKQARFYCWITSLQILSD